MKKGKSDGKIHEQNAIITLVFLICIAFVVAWSNLPLGLGIVFGGIMGVFITPDLDHEWRTHNEWTVDKVFGKFIGRSFTIYWSIYEAIPHRSPLSHGGFPPFGPLIMVAVATPIRLAYSFLWLLPLIYFFPEVRLWISRIPLLFWCGLYGGIALQDEVHWIRDYVFSAAARKSRRKYILRKRSNRWR